MNLKFNETSLLFNFSMVHISSLKSAINRLLIYTFGKLKDKEFFLNFRFIYSIL